MKTMIESGRPLTAPYVPPAVGNGDLSVQIDREGAMAQKSYCEMIPGIRRAGYRYDNPTGRLIPLGYFTQSLSGLGELTRWEQSLETDDGVVECDCSYSDGTHIRTTVFCHLGKNILVIRKELETTLDGHFEFIYHLDPPRAKVTQQGEFKLAYKVDGMEQYEGTVSVTADVPVKASWQDGQLRLSTTARSCTFFIAFDEETTASGEELLAESRELWREFWNEGYVRIPSPRLQQVYQASLYHLRISTTRWSIPTGIFETHWNGLYFGFDEYFNMMGLMTAGHVESALHVPRFRFSILPQARFRSNSSKIDRGTALFPWETNEQGGENSPRGFWYEHIFHESHFVLEGWQAYRFTGDKEQLREKYYPLMRACAEYLRIFHVTYDAAGRRVIGVCTDLERMGSAISNPFMTSCSVIAAFEAAAKGAEVLGVDEELAKQWRELAAALRQSLPHDENSYRPYDGFNDYSIAQLAGIFPYGVISRDEPLQRNGVEDYRRHRRQCGNMYQMGSGICSWYLAWEAITLVRMRQPEEALAVLEELEKSCGNWGEMFEIREMEMRPYFTTAAGCLVQAVNEMFLQFQGDTPVLAPAVPQSWRDYSFRLAGLYGSVVQGKCVDGKVIED